MAFVGEVKITLYYGTLYDDINVPYYSTYIVDFATKTKTIESAAVWQTTWLASAVVDVSDYQEIVGAQYASIDEIGAVSRGRHWYKVLSYAQVSNKSCLLELEYDALLSIGINNIKSITGIIRRWSVDNDAPFRYVKTTEPLNQAKDYAYSYFRYNCADDSLGAGTGTSLYGFPYDMSQKPTVEEYVNPDGVQTSIFLPVLKPTGIHTVFRSAIGGTYRFTDGFLYWTEGKFRSKVLPCLNAAIGLGYELMSSCWALPNASNFVEISETAGSIDGAVSTLIGKELDVVTGFGLYPGGYNNQKAADMGNFLTLYNEITGDSVTVETCDLSGTGIHIMCNPYINGCFAARFNGYLDDNQGYSGLVKSGGWLPCNYTLGNGAGTSANLIANAQQIASVEATYAAASNSYYATTTNSYMSANRSYEMNAYNQEKQIANAAVNVASNPLSLGAWAGGAVDVGFSFSDKRQADANTSTAYYNALRSADVALENAKNARDLQRGMLATNGNMGQVAPPPTKFSNSFNVNANSYEFVVRLCTLSTADRQRLDRFMTAYGYNVDGVMLNNPSQLYTRQRFTFIQADDVQILETVLADYPSRIRDFATIKNIQERFSAGLRIWHGKPDFNYSAPNPIRSGG